MVNTNKKKIKLIKQELKSPEKICKQMPNLLTKIKENFDKNLIPLFIESLELEKDIRAMDSQYCSDKLHCLDKLHLLEESFKKFSKNIRIFEKDNILIESVLGSIKEELSNIKQLPPYQIYDLLSYIEKSYYLLNQMRLLRLQCSQLIANEYHFFILKIDSFFRLTRMKDFPEYEFSLLQILKPLQTINQQSGILYNTTNQELKAIELNINHLHQKLKSWTKNPELIIPVSPDNTNSYSSIQEHQSSHQETYDDQFENLYSSINQSSPQETSDQYTQNDNHLSVKKSQPNTYVNLPISISNGVSKKVTLPPS